MSHLTHNRSFCGRFNRIHSHTNSVKSTEGQNGMLGVKDQCHVMM